MLLTAKDLKKLRKEIIEAGGYSKVAEVLNVDPSYPGKILRSLDKANKNLNVASAAAKVIKKHRDEQAAQVALIREAIA